MWHVIKERLAWHLPAEDGTVSASFGLTHVNLSGTGYQVLFSIVIGLAYSPICPKLLSVLYVSLRYQVVGIRRRDVEYPATRSNPLL